MTYTIEIGNKVLINKIGVFLGITGTILTILIFVLIFTSFLMPNEMTFIFLVELIKSKIYFILPAAILMLLIGLKIADIRKYRPTKLTLKLDKILFLKNGELIEIPEPRLHKITKSKSLLSKDNRIKITTDTHKEYNIKGTEKLFEHLIELFPDKTKLKNVG